MTEEKGCPRREGPNIEKALTGRQFAPGFGKVVLTNGGSGFKSQEALTPNDYPWPVFNARRPFRCAKRGRRGTKGRELDFVNGRRKKHFIGGRNKTFQHNPKTENEKKTFYGTGASANRVFSRSREARWRKTEFQRLERGECKRNSREKRGLVFKEICCGEKLKQRRLGTVGIRSLKFGEWWCDGNTRRLGC